MVLLDEKPAAELAASRYLTVSLPRQSTDSLPAYSAADSDVSSESSVSATVAQFPTPTLPDRHPQWNGHPPPSPQARNGRVAHDPQPGPSSAPMLRPSASANPVAPEQPINYLSLERTNGSIRGTYRVDPLILPNGVSQLLRGAPLLPESRDNLALSVTNGAIKVEIVVMPPPAPARKPPRCRISLLGRNGSVSVRIADRGYPISLHLTIHNGSAHLRLPRSFVGPLTSVLRTSALGASPKLAKCLTVLSDPSNGATSRQRYAFVGDYRGAGWDRDPKGWRGDELVIDAVNAGVRLSYVDDAEGDEVVSYGQWKSILGSVM